MTQYEVYAACATRSAAQAQRFLETFVPVRALISSELQLPEFSDNPSEIFADVDSLVLRLEQKTDEEHALYWTRNEPGDPYQAMLFFTKDGGMIAGIASTHPDPADLLQQLATAVDARYGVVVLEERPPATLRAFYRLCRAAPGARLVDGELFPEPQNSHPTLRKNNV